MAEKQKTDGILNDNSDLALATEEELIFDELTVLQPVEDEEAASFHHTEQQNDAPLPSEDDKTSVLSSIHQGNKATEAQVLTGIVSEPQENNRLDEVSPVWNRSDSETEKTADEIAPPKPVRAASADPSSEQIGPHAVEDVDHGKTEGLDVGVETMDVPEKAAPVKEPVAAHESARQGMVEDAPSEMEEVVAESTTVPLEAAQDIENEISENATVDSSAEDTPKQNADPVSADSAATATEDTAYSGSVSASDVDGDSLTYTLDNGPANGFLAFNADGTYTYTPDADYNGTDTFSYQVSDGQGGTTTATVTLTVDPTNDNPVSADSAATATEDTAYSGSVSASDVDGDSLTYTLDNGPANGFLAFNADGTYTYTPDADYNGTDTFSYQVSDGQGGTTTATVTLTVDPTNDNPVSADSAATATEDTVYSGSVSASDVDGDSLTYTLDSGPSNGSLTFNADGAYTYTPDADYNGTDTFSYQVSDGQGGTTTATVTLTVDPANDNPVTVDSTGYLSEDTAFTSSVSATDVDGDSLSYVLDSGPANGSLAFNADGTYTYTPNEDYSGTDTFSYQVSDGQGGVDTATVTLDVSEVVEEANNDNLGAAGNDDLVGVSTGHGKKAVHEDDTLYGGEGDDSISGLGGNDELYGGSGADTLDGGDDNDLIFGGDGNDVIEGGDGSDSLEGNDGDDLIFGDKDKGSKKDAGDDVIDGGTGDDTVYGGDGDDQITGSAGDDWLYGDAGEDLFIWDTRDGNDYMNGGAGWDRIALGKADGDDATADGGWTVQLDDGSEYHIDPSANGDAYLDIANDSSGTIVDDATGETITFEGVERIEF